MTLHELPLERRNLHGHFSPDLPPALTVEPSDRIAFATLDAGWGTEPPRLDRLSRAHFEPRGESDSGHALVGPIEVRGASPGDVLEVRIDRIRLGTWGFTIAGGWRTPLNDALGVGEGDEHLLVWTLDPDELVGRDQYGRRVRLRPFLGVLGMPPPEPGVHSTQPPRAWGGNVDCKELVEGSTLLLPVSVPGALFSAGDGHAVQGDGEVSGLAIECPLERVELTLRLRDDLRLETPIARTPSGWVTLGFDEDLDAAAAVAVGAMLDLLRREAGLDRRDALALASLVVDVRVTQLVNGAQGVHAVLPIDALRMLGAAV
jgi:acetamidase/formamidase